MSQKQAACARLSESQSRSKKIKVWANGDPKCYVFNINPKEFKNWSVIMNYLTQTMLPTFGAIKALVELKTRKMINDFDGLDPRRKYIGIGATCKSLRMPIGGYKTNEELNRQAQRDSKTSATSKSEKVNDSKKFLAKTEKMQYTVIYVAVNGSDETPQKAVFKRDELKKYHLICNYLANILKMTDGIQNIYTSSGTMLADATEFRHGALYVAVPFGEHFQKMDYVGLFKEKYPFCKKNKYIKVIASRHSYIALKRKLSCERAKASKKIGTSSRHSVQSQIPPIYTFKSIAREREADIKTKPTMEKEKSLPLYNQIKSKQSQFIRFTIRPAPRQPDMPKQFQNSRKIPKLIRQRLAEEKCKMTRRHTFSGPSSSMIKNYLPESLSMPADAQSRMMEVFKKISLTSGVENILASGEAADEKESSDQNAMYQYLQSLGRIESSRSPEMDVYFKTLLEKIVKMVEKKSEHKPIDDKLQEEEHFEEIINEPMVKRFNSLHHSGAKISIEIKQMSDEKLPNVQQVASGNKLFNVKVTYQPSVEEVNLIKNVKDLNSKENQFLQQKASGEAIVVNDQIKENKVNSKTSSYVSGDRIFKEIATPNGSIKISMGSNSNNTSKRSFILKERSSAYLTPKDDSSNFKERVNKPTSDTCNIDTSSKVSSRTNNSATNQVLLSKTSNRQIKNLSHQEIKVDQQLTTELKPHMVNQSATICTCIERESIKNVTKEDNKKSEEPIIQNNYSSEQNNLTDSIINTPETIKSQISNKQNNYEKICLQEKHADDDLIKEVSDKYLINNRKEENKDIKILFEQSICDSTQHLCSDSFERTSISSSSCTQQLNLERAKDIYRSSMQEMDDKIGQRTTISGASVRKLVVNKVKSSRDQEDIEKSKTNICGACTQHIGNKKPDNSKFSEQTLKNSENNYGSNTSEKVVKNDEQGQFSRSNIVTINNMIVSELTNEKSQEVSNISRSSIDRKSIQNRAVSRSSIKQLATKNKEEINISRSSMLAAKMFENKSFSRSSTQKFSVKSKEETNISKTGMLAANILENICISELTAQESLDKSLEQTSIIMSNIAADEGVTNMITISSTERLADENIQQTNISGSKHLGIKYQDPINISGSSVLENVENRTISRSNTQGLNIKSKELINNLIIAEDIDNRSINESNIRLLANKTEEQINIYRSSELSAQNIENVENDEQQLACRDKEQTNNFGLSTLTAKNVEQQVTSRSSELDTIIVEIENSSRSSIPKLCTNGEKQTNIYDSRILAAENVKSIKQISARSVEQTNIVESNTSVRNIIENSPVSGSSIRQLASKNKKQSNVSGSSILIAETTSKSNTQQLDDKNGVESSIQRFLNTQVKQNTISKSSIAAKNQDETSTFMSSTLPAENVESKIMSGSSIRNSSMKSSEQTYISNLSILAAENFNNMTQQLSDENMDNVSIGDRYTVCQNIISESSRQQLTAKSDEQSSNILGTNTLSVVGNSEHSGTSIRQEATKNEEVSNGTISKIGLRKLASISDNQSYFSKSSILGDKTNSRPSTQHITPESGSEILAVDSAEKRTVSESSSQQSATKIKKQVNISSSSILSGNAEKNRMIFKTSLQLETNNIEDSTFSGLKISSKDIRNISEISLRQLAPQTEEKLNILGSSISNENKQQLGEETNISGPVELDVDNGIMSISDIQQITRNSGLSVRQLAPDSGEKAYFSKASLLTSESVENKTISGTSMSESVGNKTFSGTSMPKLVTKSEEKRNTPQSSIQHLEDFTHITNSVSSARQMTAKSGEQTNVSELGLVIPTENIENRTISRSSVQRLCSKSDENINIEDRANSGLGIQLASKNVDQPYSLKSGTLTTESFENCIISGTDIRQLAARSADQTNICESTLLDINSAESKTISRSSTQKLSAPSNNYTNISGSNMSMAEGVQDSRNSSGSIVLNMSREFVKQINSTESSKLLAKCIDDESISRSSIRQFDAKSEDQTNMCITNILDINSEVNKTISGSSTLQLSKQSKNHTNISGSNILVAEDVQDIINSSKSSMQNISLTCGGQRNNTRSSELPVNGIENESISTLSKRQFAAKSEDQTNICESSLIDINSAVNKTISGSSTLQLSTGSYNHTNISGSNVIVAEDVRDIISSSRSSLQNISLKCGEQRNNTLLSELPVEVIENEAISTSSIRQFATKSEDQTNICVSSLIDINSAVNKTISGSSTLQLSTRSYNHTNISGSNIVFAEGVRESMSSSGPSTQNVSLKYEKQINNTRSSELPVESIENGSVSSLSMRQLADKSEDQRNSCRSRLLDINNAVNETISESSKLTLSTRSYNHTNISGSNIIVAEGVQDSMSSTGSSIQNVSPKYEEQINITRSSELPVEGIENGSKSWSTILTEESVQKQNSSKSSIQNFCCKGEEESVEQTNISGSNLLVTKNVENINISGSTISAETTYLSKSNIFTPDSVENRTVSESIMQQFVVNSGDQIIIPKLCVLHVENAENATNSGVIIQLAAKYAEPTTTYISIAKQRWSPGSSLQLSQESKEHTNVSNSSLQVVENVDSITITGSNTNNISDKDTVYQNIVHDLISNNIISHENICNKEIAEIEANNTIINDPDKIINGKESGSIEEKIINQQLHYKETIHKLLGNDQQDTITNNELNIKNVLFKGISTVEDKSLVDQRIIDEDDEEILKKLSKEEESIGDEISYNKLTKDGEQIPFLQASNSPSSTTTVEQMLMLNEGTIDLLDRNEDPEADERKTNKEKAFDIPGEPVN